MSAIPRTHTKKSSLIVGLCEAEIEPDAMLLESILVEKDAAHCSCEDGGFKIGAAKNRASYHSRDMLLVGTDTGAEGDMTDSGYTVALDTHDGVPKRRGLMRISTDL